MKAVDEQDTKNVKCLDVQRFDQSSLQRPRHKFAAETCFLGVERQFWADFRTLVRQFEAVLGMLAPRWRRQSSDYLTSKTDRPYFTMLLPRL